MYRYQPESLVMPVAVPYEESRHRELHRTRYKQESRPDSSEQIVGIWTIGDERGATRRWLQMWLLLESHVELYFGRAEHEGLAHLRGGCSTVKGSLESDLVKWALSLRHCAKHQAPKDPARRKIAGRSALVILSSG